MPDLTIQRESTEYIYFPITDEAGHTITDGVDVALTNINARPTEWTQPDTVSGRLALLMTDQQPGRYRAWVRIDNGTERIVLPVGAITIA